MSQHITSVNDLYERTQAMGYTPDGAFADNVHRFPLRVLLFSLFNA